MTFGTYMLSCAARTRLRQRTIAHLRTTDWPQTPVLILEDPASSEIPLWRQMSLAHAVLTRALREGADIILMLEDDLIFNAHLRHNIEHWAPLRRLASAGHHFFGSLFRPCTALKTVDTTLAYGEADGNRAQGSQALLISRATVSYLVGSWGSYPATHVDLKLARLAARVCSIVYHVPSLVQHVGVESVWGGRFIAAPDFEPEWKALESCASFATKHQRSS